MLPNIHVNSITYVQKNTKFPPKFSLRKEGVAIHLNSLSLLYYGMLFQLLYIRQHTTLQTYFRV